MISPDRMYVLALEEVQEEYEKLYAECEELKKSVMKQCPICGEKFLSPIGMELYDKNTRYKQALAPFEDEYFKDLDTKTIAELAKKSIRLTRENRKLEDALDEIEKIINSLHYQTLIFHSGNTHVLADKIQETKNQIQGIINTAKEVNNETL